MGRVLSFDYGTKRIGIAATDPLKIIASALDTIHPKDIIVYLKKYLSHESVECFVVGKPMKLDGSDSSSAVHVKNFISLLNKNFPEIPVKSIDERFTSSIAQKSMIEMGLKKKDRQKKEHVDQISAVLILQTFLDSNF
jgi:putative Holliday junction resolvase